jgi:hypothetical protein
MANMLSPEEIDALDVSSSPPARNQRGLTAIYQLSPEEIDSISLTPPPAPPTPGPEPTIKAPVQPGERPSTTAGGPRQSFNTEGESLAQQTEDLPVLGPIVHAGRAVGYAAGRSGKVIAATAGDVTNLPAAAAGYTKPLENLSEFASEPYEGKGSDRPLPIDVRAAGPGVGGFFMKAGLAPFRMVPQLAAAFGLGAMGLPSAASAAIPMLVTEKGDYDPLGAAIAAGIPGASHLGEEAVAGALKNIPIAQVVIRVLGKDPMELKGRVVQKLGGVELSNDNYRKFLEAGGGFLAANAYLAATKAPEIMALPPEQRGQAAMDMVANNLAPALLGFLRPGMSKTLERMGPDIMREYQKEFGGNGPGPEQGPAAATPQPKRPLTPGEIDAIDPEQQQSSVQQKRGGTDEVGKTPPEAGGSNSVPGATGKSPLTPEEIDSLPAAKPPVAPPVPEKPETIAAQVQMLQEGKRKAILITPGEAPPEVPAGMQIYQTPMGSFIYDPKKVSEAEIYAAVKNNTVGDILGYGIAAKPAPGTAIGAVTVRAPDGTEKQGTLTDAQNLPKVVDAAKDVASPGDTVQVESEADVIKKRQQPAFPKTIGRPPTPTVTTLPATMETARSVIKMSPEEFWSKAGAFNKINIPIGANATPEEYEELKKLHAEATTRMMEANRKAEALGDSLKDSRVEVAKQLQDPKVAPEEKARLTRELDNLKADYEKAAGQAIQINSMPQFYKEALTEYEKARAAKEPTPGQREAGNYPKRQLNVHGLEVSVENEVGSMRRSKPGAPPWEVKMPVAYGYIKGTKDNTGEHVDTFIGPNESGTSMVYVLDQIDPTTKKYDEPKTFIGFNSMKDALDAYKGSFSDNSGPTRFGGMKAFTVADFKEWLKNPEPVKAKAQAPAPPVSGPGKKVGKWTQIGFNANGKPVFVDSRGVHAYLDGNVMVEQEVSIIPGKGIQLGERGIDFTPIEAPAAQPKTPPAEKRDMPSITEVEPVTELKDRKGKEDASIRVVQKDGKWFYSESAIDFKGGGWSNHGFQTRDEAIAQAFGDMLGYIRRVVNRSDVTPSQKDVAARIENWVKSFWASHRPDEPYAVELAATWHQLQRAKIHSPEEVPELQKKLDELRAQRESHTESETGFTGGDPRLQKLILSDETGQQKAAAIKKLADELNIPVKAMQENIEFELVRMADAIARNDELTPQEKFDKLVEIYNRQPVFSSRTSTSIGNQAYSTPAPLSYALSVMTGVTPQTTVFDNTAGNGMMLIGSNLENGSMANEINDVRLNNLKQLLPQGSVTSDDATANVNKHSFQVIKVNPPFGPTPNQNYGGYSIKRLEHVIALKALESMKDDGTAALVMGAKMQPGETGKGAQWVFENYLYGHYNVVANFEVGGDLYGRQGTKWPVRVIIIAGRKDVPEKGVFAPKSVARYDSWEQVWLETLRVKNEVDHTRDSLGSGTATGLPVRPPGGSEPPVEPGSVPKGPGGTPSTPSVGGGTKRVGSGKSTDVRNPATGAGSDVTGGSVPGSNNPEQTPAKPNVGGEQNARVEGRNPGSAPTAGNEQVGVPPASGGAKPGTVSGSTPVERPAGDLAGMTEKELDDLLDEASGTKPTAPKAPSKPRAERPSIKRQPPAAPKTKSASDILKDAAKQGVTGIDETIQGLHDLFGGGANVGSGGPSFDEETYKKAEPHFKRAYEQFKAAGRSLKDFLKFILDKFGIKVRPYIKEFVQRVQREEVVPAPIAKTPPKMKDTLFQSLYVPRAQGTPFGTLTPKNIADGEHGALDALQQKVGPLTKFVAEELNMLPDEVARVLSSEQIDGVALAIDQIARGDALIIGDQTGIGKGRQAAAMIRWAILNGKIPVFFTKDPKLFTDMYGDLKDINTTIKPFIMGEPARASIVDGTTGRLLIRAPGKQVQDREMQRIQELGLKGAGYDAIFLTYSQINSRNARQLFLEQMAKQNPTVVILDEAHEAAGDNETSMQAAFISGGQVRRGSGPDQQRITVPGLLQTAGTKAGQGGVLYLSATYAKRSENMPVYFRTGLSKAADSFTQIVSAMKKGGVAIQQAVSEALAISGQYVRRERDFTGVSYAVKRVKVADEAKLIEQVDDITSVLHEIVMFSKKVIAAVEAAGEGSATAMTDAQSDMTDFAAIVHNQVGQMLLAAKADEIVSEALSAAQKGEKPLVAIMNTMESFLDQYTDEKGIRPGQPIQLRWHELLKYALSRTLRMSVDLPDGGTQISYLDPKELGLENEFNAIVAQADDISSEFPVSPIDYIIQKLNASGVKMVELTGRTSGIQYSDFKEGKGTYVVFKKANKNSVVNGFNNATYDGMLLNASGSTGLSAHASEKFKDQRPRTMVIGQPALDINVFMQTLGRIFRTGMVMRGLDENNQPFGAKYIHLILPLQAEMRPAAMAARKMKSLNANTTADTDNAIKIEAEDLFNRYGDYVVANYLDGDEELQDATRLGVEHNEDGSVKVESDIARKFTGRMAMLPNAQQEKIYGEIIPQYKALIQQLKEMGDYDLEIVVYNDWDGVRTADDQLSPGTDESNIFTASVRMQKWEIKDNRHVPTGAEMVKEQEKNLENALSDWKQFDGKVNTHYWERIKHVQNQIDKLQDEMSEAKTDVDKNRVNTQIEFKRENLRNLEKAYDKWKETLAPAISAAILRAGDGQVTEVLNSDTGDFYEGMMVDTKFPSPNGRLAPASFQFKFMVNAPGGVVYLTAEDLLSGKWTIDRSDKTPDAFTGARQGQRYERYFVVGNPIRGYGATGGRGRMVRFRAAPEEGQTEGSIITGLLMPTNWGPENLVNDPRMDLVNGKAVAFFLRNHGRNGYSEFTPVEAAGVVRIVGQPGSSRGYVIMTPTARNTGGKIYLDKDLLKITGDFTKGGRRMIATVDEEDLAKAADRIMKIVQGRFRPVGKVDQMMPKVDESNRRGGGSKQGNITQADQPPTVVRPAVDLVGVDQLRQALSTSGLSEPQQQLINAFLDSPLAEKLDGLRFHIADAIAGGWQGSYFNKLVEIVRNADPNVGPEELMHAVWDVLPEDIRNEFERMRQAELDKLIEGAKNDVERATYEDLKEDPTSGGRDFLNRGYRHDLWSIIYRLSNPSEYFAHAASEQFRARVGSVEPSFWERIKGMLKDFLAMIKKGLGLKQTREQWLNNILAGRFKVNPNNARMSERQAALKVENPVRDAAIEQGIKENYIPTQVLGTTDYVRGREELTDADRAESITYAKKIFDQAGIPVTQQDDYWTIDPSPDADAAGAKLIDILKKEIANKNAPGKHGALLASLLNSVVINFKQGRMNGFSRPVREELYEIAQSDRSQRGIALAALAGVREDLNFVSQNVDVVLHRIYSDAFGGPAVSGVVGRILREFRDYFTDSEIRDAADSDPALENLVTKLLALNRKDEGGRVYRKVQALLKPKKRKPLAALEGDARVNEAVDQIIENARLLGIEPKKSPNKALSPLRRLLLMVTPGTAERIDNLIANAVSDGERNAGIKFAIANAQTPEERQQLQDYFSSGGMPDEEQIDGGLDLPEFSHWRAIRDDLLGYDPTTLKLVQDLIRSNFKATRFGKTEAPTVDTRIDLNALAKAPEAEVRRVLDAYYANLEANMDLSEATGDTSTRVRDMVEAQVSDQLEKARIRFRDPMFREPVAQAAVLTPEQQIGRLINAGLFRDPRLDIPEMVGRVANKSRIAKLTPKLSALVKAAFETPFYRQSDLQGNFANQLVERLGVAPEEAAKAAEVFGKAFAGKFALAKASALKKAQESITPKEKVVFGQKRALWERIERAVNAGVFDTGEILRTIATAHGWSVPSEAQVTSMRNLAEEEQRLRDLTPRERAAVGNNPSDIAKAMADREAATLEKRVLLKKKMEVNWSRMVRPISLAHPWDTRRNIAAAVNELTSANLLLRVGFAPRQLLSVLTQGAIHTPTRAIAVALERYFNDKGRGRDANLFTEAGTALKEAYTARLGVIKAALVSTRAAFLGRGEARNVDRLMSSIAAIERVAAKADEYEANGEHAKAFMTRAFSLIRLGYRVAQALDNLHGVPAEAQEMRAQVVTALREQGKSKAEIEVAIDRVMGDIPTEYADAYATVTRIFNESGIRATPKEIEEAAWQVVKRRQYDRIAELGLPADDFQENARMLRSTIGWNERETTGLGGVIGRGMQGLTTLAQDLGLPLPLARFANAIAITINRHLTFTPLYKLAEAGGDNKSPWFRTRTDQYQRRVEAVVGSGLGIAFFLMVLAGALKVILKPPTDKEERDLFDREGHKAGTVELQLPDGKFLPVSLSVGPLEYVAPYLAAGQAVNDLMAKRQKEQAKLDAAAAKAGVAPGKIRALNAADLLGVASSAAYQSLMSGRTASGLVASTTDYGTFNPSKFAASQLSPLVPGLPELQELGRMGGATLDTKMAGFWDFMLPLPTSQAAKVNLLGDPVGNQDAVQRVVQILTGGTYGPVDAPARKSESAYAALFGSGYRPPSISPGKGYSINGEFRPLNEKELQAYTLARGQNLKNELAVLGPNATAAEAQEAYGRANVSALQSVGVDVATSAGAGSGVSGPGTGAGTGVPSRTRRTVSASVSPSGVSATARSTTRTHTPGTTVSTSIRRASIRSAPIALGRAGRGIRRRGVRTRGPSLRPGGSLRTGSGRMRRPSIRRG